MCMCMCNKCTKIGALLLLILGVLFLIVDLTEWNFYGINWWTAVLLLSAVSCFGMSGCKDCQAMCNPKKK